MKPDALDCATRIPKPYVAPARHGADWHAYFAQTGIMPLDFSSNVNPLGMSPAARLAARAALDQGHLYPDPFCRDLRRAIASHDGTDESHVLCGAGAGDLIVRLAQVLASRCALVVQPTFCEYERALRSAGTRVLAETLAPEQGFSIDADKLELRLKDIDAIWLCSPNNPTATKADPGALARLAVACEAAGVYLVVDECFCGLMANPAAQSARRLAGELGHLVIIDAFTKTYGMAGLRLGYITCADQGILVGVQEKGQYWPVSGEAQAAGVAALHDESFVEQARSLIAHERPTMAQGIADAGCAVVPGVANFILFKTPVHDLKQRLLCKGILIRDCSDFPGLSEGYYRVAVRTHSENRKLIDVLDEELADLREGTACG